MRGLDFGFKLIDNLACLNQNAANLNDPIAMLNAGTGSFQVNDRINRLALFLTVFSLVFTVLRYISHHHDTIHLSS